MSTPTNIRSTAAKLEQLAVRREAAETEAAHVRQLLAIQVYAANDEGMSARAIARHAGISHTAVANILKAAPPA